MTEEKEAATELAPAPVSAVRKKRRFLAPEVVQTSEMDCGPASLVCLLEGFGVSASYGRIREACQTEVDGTSIDTIEEIIDQLGFDAEQVMVPLDHVLLEEADAVPAIIVIVLPNGYTHFVVLWRAQGPLVQVMDPAAGRRWQTREAFLRQLYEHTMPVPRDAWREWADGERFLKPLRRRALEVGADPVEIDRWSETACLDPGWRSLGALDAAVRMVSAVVRSGGVDRGKEASRLIGHLFDRARADAESAAIPDEFWSVRPVPASGAPGADSAGGASDADSAGGAPGADSAGGEVGEGAELLLKGAVLIAVHGPKTKEAEVAPEEAAAAVPKARLPAELVAALEEKPVRPLRIFFDLLWKGGGYAVVALFGGIALTSAATLLEALLLRGLVDLGHELTITAQRILAVGVLAAFLFTLGLLDSQILRMLQRLGRGLETELRVRFLEKLPRLGVRYFRSRPSTDMTERIHDAQRLRMIPDLAAELTRSGMSIIATTLAILWLDPKGFVPAVGVALVSFLIPMISQAAFRERDLRFRTHAGALFRFYLDAQLGLIPLRTHGAERAIRREHENVLVEWARTGKSLLRLMVLNDLFGGLVGIGFASWLFFDYVAGGSGTQGMLLVVYWALSLASLGQRFALALRQYPMMRNITARLIEPLGAPDEHQIMRGAGLRGHATAVRAGGGGGVGAGGTGVAIAIEKVTVRGGGHTILEDIDLEIRSGEHVAVVGLSGAGKSSLVGILLGWHTPSLGRVTIDGEPLDASCLARLRQNTAWVDPSVRLWNRSLLENLLYGSPWKEGAPVSGVIAEADLKSVLDRIPDGLTSTLGEGGALVSGGEGQRVRLGRALIRAGARLAVLDEPFRGLDIEKRRALLDRARRWWPSATLICITHDVAETMSFPRVLVIEEGRIVEDGSPRALAEKEDGRFRSLLRADEALRSAMWRGALWRRVRIEEGRLVEQHPDGPGARK